MTNVTDQRKLTAIEAVKLGGGWISTVGRLRAMRGNTTPPRKKPAKLKDGTFWLISTR